MEICFLQKNKRKKNLKSVMKEMSEYKVEINIIVKKFGNKLYTSHFWICLQKSLQ